jgi:hypothetical protein
MITLGFTYEQIANMYIEDEDKDDEE